MSDQSQKSLVESRRLAYLQAMHIDVWRPRNTDAHSEAPAAQEGAADRPLQDWQSLRAAVAGCTRCELHKSRTQTVFGVGNEAADWMIIGEAPGMEEDRRGEPFVGRAGKLLDQMLRAVGLDRSKVFIANVLKCRPPNNRDPSAGEAAACRPYLDRQIELVQPRLILAVGRIAAQRLLETDAPVGRMRGQAHYYGERRIPLVVTYHPAYLLRSPLQKRKSWQDLCLAQNLIRDSSP
ncbi:MAG: uracil-DNA glycosylase [Gammaproteobacteria bacterium]|nr:uracil-DNA glycosylase [Gammaproteobacteria bacterium]